MRHEDDHLEKSYFFQLFAGAALIESGVHFIEYVENEDQVKEWGRLLKEGLFKLVVFLVQAGSESLEHHTDSVGNNHVVYISVAHHRVRFLHVEKT